MLKNIQEWVLLLVIVGVSGLVGNWVGYDVFPLTALPGMAVLIGICLAGFILKEIIPLNFPSIAYISIIGVVVSMPWFPGSDKVVEWTTQVQLLALTTPILAYAGIAIGRSWSDFVKLGWRTLIVASLVMIGTFLGSAVIAEMILGFQGII
ncbi:hypothetical protein PGH26_02315 [Sporosarcina jeotgali]|uniref:DUF340 domain-containing protein n=1 Tax=Sporosarcina jeotgali TaxID=3020056 RepID=A0ABZ0KY50_9BACL|nr:hypothetical protein [Sporosarcina sp. B2O-1]WOV84783.1 hypothetical protein PGH26_02315 [Sporosarcina sp. B2O-1]